MMAIVVEQVIIDQGPRIVYVCIYLLMEIHNCTGDQKAY